MYNSRPRSYRSGFAVPENYSGNAFLDGEIKEPNIVTELDNDNVIRSTSLEEETEKETVTEENESTEAKDEAEQENVAVSVGAMSRPSRFGFNASKLFRGGIGFEELLIIALILLISQSENNEDVIVLLVLLLFIS